MPELKGSKTEKNLMTAFEGERHARRVSMIDRLDRGEALE